MSRYPGTAWPWLALGVALLQPGVARAEILSPSPSRALSLLEEGETTTARLTFDSLGLPGEPVALAVLTPSAPEAGAPWSNLNEARAHRAPASPRTPAEQPTPLRWSAGSLHGPVLLGKVESALVSPALMVASNWWLAYRYRTAYDIATLFPLFTVGLSLNGDLL